MRSSRGCLLAFGASAAAALVVGCSRAPLDAAPSSPADGGAEAGGAPTLDWAIAVGQPTSVHVYGSSTAVAVVPTSDGGAIVAGVFTGTVSFAPDKTLVAGPNGTGFVARYRVDQQLVWVRSLVAPLVAIADAAALGNDEVAVAGWFEGALDAGPGPNAPIVSLGGLDLFTARVAADGSVRWSVRAGGADDDIARALAVRRLPGGDLTLAITGAVGPAAAFGALPPSPPGAGPIYAAALDGEGRFVWAAFAGGGVPGQGYGVALDGSGNVFVTGYVNGPASFGSDAAGAPVIVDPSIGRAFVARWNAQGALAWARPLAGPAGEGAAVAVASDGRVVACGLFEGEAGFGPAGTAPVLVADVPGVAGTFVAALAPTDGATLWARRLAGSGVRPWQLRASPSGGSLIAASFGGGVVIDPEGPRPARLVSRGGDDPAFIRLGPDGALAWATSGGGPGDDEGLDLNEGEGGQTWAAGTYVGPALFGAGDRTTTLGSGTDGAGFLLRLAARL